MRTRTRAGLWRRSLAGCSALLAGALPGLAQSDTPDQVYALRRSRNEVVTHLGVVTRNELGGIALTTTDGSEKTFDAGEVVRVTFGDVPTAYSQAQTDMARADWENAAKRFRYAATDSDTRAVVAASARLLAGTCLLRLGASDPAHFQEAASEFETFLTDHPNNRQVPEAEVQRARALWLSGDPAAAATLFRSVFDKGTAAEPAPGYGSDQALRAGMSAGRALLAAGDSLGAKDAFDVLQAALDARLAAFDGSDDERRALEALRAEARLGEGFRELIGGNPKSARTFFQGELSRADASSPPELRFACELGLAEADFAESKLREAQLRFARVAALDHTNRDRVARALLRQAQCAKQLADPEWKSQASAWVGVLIQEYGDTPWARPGREFSATLQ